MRALILAAGMGSRLMPLTADRPKVLVELAGEPLLGRMLSCLASAGIREAVVVTGYRRDAVERWLEHGNVPLPVRTVHNDDYERINNAHSVYVARDALLGEAFVKFDGDLLLSPELVGLLLRAPFASAALIDTSERPDAEAMKASVRGDGTIAAFGKWLPASEAHGESIGIERIAESDASTLFDAIERLVHREGRLEAYYEDAYHRMIQDGFSMGAVDTAGMPWTEIDDAADLARAAALLARQGEDKGS